MKVYKENDVEAKLFEVLDKWKWNKDMSEIVASFVDGMKSCPTIDVPEGDLACGLTILKPCPFCGSKVTRFELNTPYEGRHTMEVDCIICGTRFEIGISPHEDFELAIRRWNKRTPQKEG